MCAIHADHTWTRFRMYWPGLFSCCLFFCAFSFIHIINKSSHVMDFDCDAAGTVFIRWHAKMNLFVWLQFILLAKEWKEEFVKANTRMIDSFPAVLSYFIVLTILDEFFRSSSIQRASQIFMTESISSWCKILWHKRHVTLLFTISTSKFFWIDSKIK